MAALASSSSSWLMMSAVTDTWRFSGSGSFTETVPVLGRMAAHS